MSFSLPCSFVAFYLFFVAQQTLLTFFTFFSASSVTMASKQTAAPPQYTVYFAKSDELKHVDFASLGLVKHEGDFQFRDRAVDIYTMGAHGATVGFTCGPMQGHAFYYDFVAYVSSCFRHPNYRGVAMCGICAGNKTTVKVGDVCVGTKAKLLQGKLSSDRFEEVLLDPVNDGRSTQSGLIDKQNFSFDSEAGSTQTGFVAHTGTYLQSPFVLESDLSSLFSRHRYGDRKIVAIDMESWFCLNAQNQLEADCIFPVIKGVSDFGEGKVDEFHRNAVNNSVRVALQMFQTHVKLETKPKLRTSASFASGSVRKRKTEQEQATMLSWTELQTLLPPEDFVDDIALLDKALRTESYRKLGIRALTQYKNFLTPEAFSILSSAIAGGKKRKPQAGGAGTESDGLEAEDAEMECDQDSEDGR